MSIFEKSWVSQDVTLWIAFFLTILLTLAIQLMASHWKINLLDMIASPAKARNAISQMSETQKRVHLWITATLDVAYPLSYGYLFAGSAMRFFPQNGSYLALPSLLAIVMDLTEGFIQVLALKSVYELLDLKKYITLLKFGFVLLGLGIALIGLARELFMSL